MPIAYNLGKVSVGFITVLSLASMPQGVKGSMTSCVPVEYEYDSESLFSDTIGEVCVSSELQNKTIGDIVIDNSVMSEFVQNHKANIFKLHITGVSKHVSKFDFEEEYEEI